MWIMVCRAIREAAPQTTKDSYECFGCSLTAHLSAFKIYKRYKDKKIMLSTNPSSSKITAEIESVNAVFSSR